MSDSEQIDIDNNYHKFLKYLSTYNSKIFTGKILRYLFDYGYIIKESVVFRHNNKIPRYLTVYKELIERDIVSKLPFDYRNESYILGIIKGKNTKLKIKATRRGFILDDRWRLT